MLSEPGRGAPCEQTVSARSATPPGKPWRILRERSPQLPRVGILPAAALESASGTWEHRTNARCVCAAAGGPGGRYPPFSPGAWSPPCACRRSSCHSQVPTKASQRIRSAGRFRGSPRSIPACDLLSFQDVTVWGECPRDNQLAVWRCDETGKRKDTPSPRTRGPPQAERPGHRPESLRSRPNRAGTGPESPGFRAFRTGLSVARFRPIQGAELVHEVGQARGRASAISTENRPGTCVACRIPGPDVPGVPSIPEEGPLGSRNGASLRPTKRIA